jgi:hypothetical protein
MNEKIKQLAKKTNLWDMLDKYSCEFGNANSEQDCGTELEKFVDLIVKECIGIADELVNRNSNGTWTSNELYTDYNGALFEVKRRIEETFEIEE